MRAARGSAHGDGWHGQESNAGDEDDPDADRQAGEGVVGTLGAEGDEFVVDGVAVIVAGLQDGDRGLHDEAGQVHGQRRETVDREDATTGGDGDGRHRRGVAGHEADADCEADEADGRAGNGADDAAAESQEGGDGEDEHCERADRELGAAEAVPGAGGQDTEARDEGERKGGGCQDGGDRVVTQPVPTSKGRSRERVSLENAATNARVRLWSATEIGGARPADCERRRRVTA